MTPGSINGDDFGSEATTKTKAVLDHSNLKKHNKNTKENSKEEDKTEDGEPKQKPWSLQDDMTNKPPEEIFLKYGSKIENKKK